jgi:hypothetical protein
MAKRISEGDVGNECDAGAVGKDICPTRPKEGATTSLLNDRLEERTEEGNGEWRVNDVPLTIVTDDERRPSNSVPGHRRMAETSVFRRTAPMVMTLSCTRSGTAKDRSVNGISRPDCCNT